MKLITEHYMGVAVNNMLQYFVNRLTLDQI